MMIANKSKKNKQQRVKIKIKNELQKNKYPKF